MCHRRERGLALLGAVAALAGLSLIAAAIATTAVRDQRRTREAMATLQADALVRSGVTTAAALLSDWAALEQPDTLRAPWAVHLPPQALGAGKITAEVVDEARRLNLNAPGDDGPLRRLLAEIGLDPELADAVADWTDSDDLPRRHGAERSWYRSAVPPRLPANGPLASVGELVLVRGFDAPALERLRPFVGVAGELAINPNTASREVLRAWLGDPGRADTILAEREHGTVECDDLPHCTTRGQRYTVRVTAEVDRVRRTAEVTLRVLGGAPAILAWRAVPG